MQGTNKEFKTSALVARLIRDYLKPYFPRILLAFLLMVIAAAMTAAFAKLIEPILDEVLNNKQRHLIWPMASAVFAAFAIRGLATYGHTLLMNKTGHEIIAQIQHELIEKYMSLDLVFFHQNTSGQLSSRIINDVTVMRNAVVDAMTGFGKNLMTLVFLVALMFYQDWVLSLIAFVALPFGAAFVVVISKKIRRVSGNIQGEIGHLSEVLIQIFQGIRQVKAYGQEKFEQKRAGERVDQLKRHAIKAVRLGTLSVPFNEALVGLAIMGVIVYGGFQIADGDMTTGQLMSFIAAFSLAYEPMKKLAKLNNALQMGLGASERVFEILDQQPQVVDQRGAKNVTLKKPDIVFQDVTFGYEDDGYALNGVSFTADKGKVTALVGPSGSGKTTCLNLIPRFYDLQGGSIQLGGHDIAKIKLKSLRANIALVSQDITIFDDTVRANIAYGLQKTTEKDVIKAAKAAAAHEFIMDMPDGYDTRLGENGVKLSGGQRQRLSIARAILRNAPILLLDEATSALDNESEKLIQKSLEKFRKGRTVVVIAHRLSTVKDADKIVVLNEGRVVEEGAHDALMKQNDGIYTTMYQAGLKE